jgi:hypothetical protein
VPSMKFIKAKDWVSIDPDSVGPVATGFAKAILVVSYPIIAAISGIGSLVTKKK